MYSERTKVTKHKRKDTELKPNRKKGLEKTRKNYPHVENLENIFCLGTRTSVRNVV